MSDNRELGLEEIYERIKEKRSELDIDTFKRIPTRPVQKSDLICVLMIEGNDTIVKKSNRSTTGYPASRLLEVTIEIIAKKETDVRTLTRNLRSVIFTDRITGNSSSIIAENVFINENRTEGPMGFGMPNVVGMRLVLDLVYTDDGL